MKTRVLPLFLLVLLAGGCGHIRLRQSLTIAPTDWIMYGGSRERSNKAMQPVSVPLELRWKYDASAGFGTTAAAAADSLLFVGNLQGEVHAIDIRTGKNVGAMDFGAAIVGTPVLQQKRMFVALTREEHNLISYDLEKGSIEWRTSVGDVESSPLLLDNRLYVTTLQGKLYAVRASDGKIEWSFVVPREQKSRMIHSSPASDGNLIVFGCDDGNVYAVRKEDGALAWSAKTEASILASPSIEAGIVYVGSLDESLYAFNLADGALRWKRNLGSKIYASQAAGIDRVIVGTSAGDIFGLDPASGEIRWTAHLKSAVSAPPLISGDLVFVPSIACSISAYRLADGERVWNYDTEGRVKSMPVATAGRLFVLAEDRVVLAFSEVRSE